ncbi:unnamed protein product [Nesidiocoris tenuis]|uniref:Uncharacterized protein n=1 Tax=Nesidiocoris tenuis TaxID=355587 RepID=A0A6H5FWD4_9HEMI|nr:unnamed protein product [Nesidiocoris tenuis]
MLIHGGHSGNKLKVAEMNWRWNPSILCRALLSVRVPTILSFRFVVKPRNDKIRPKVEVRIVRPVSAFLIIDVQNDFISGSLSISQCTAQQNGADVCAEEAQTYDTVTFDGPHLMNQRLWPRHCVQESWGAELHKDLKLKQLEL